MAETVSRRVLVVDDNQDSAKMLALMLKIEGHDTHTAFDGPSALKAAQVLSPEVVFLDIGLPGMNGYAVAQELRALPGFENVMLVAMTGHGEDEDRRRSKEAGFDHHLVKPADPEVVIQLLAQ